MKLIRSGESPGFALKLIKGCAANNDPTGSVAWLRSMIATVVPPRALYTPVAPGPIVAWSGGNGETLLVQVIVFCVKVMVPAMLKVPITDATACSQTQSASTPANMNSLRLAAGIRGSSLRNISLVDLHLHGTPQTKSVQIRL